MKTWYLCPYCGKKIILKDDTAESKGIFIKCRGCKREIEIKISK